MTAAMREDSPIVRESGPPLGEDQITAMEGQLQCELPRGYRHFLARHNGGRLSPCTFSVPTHPEQEFDLHVMFGLSRPVATSNLGWYVIEYPELVAEGLVPIASTDTSDLILLRYRGDEVGSVWFWDSMAETPASALHRVAADFAKFLSGLH